MIGILERRITAVPPLSTQASIISYWKLDDNSNDFVGTNNGSDTNVSYEGTSTARFEGTGDIIVPDNDSLSFTDDIFSISLWVWFSSVAGTILFFNKISASNREYEIRLSSGDLRFYLYDNVSANWVNRQVTLSPSTFTWYHICCTSDGSTRRIYVNGSELSGTNNSAGTYSNMKNTSAPLYFGAYYGGLRLVGNLDEVAIFDIALDSTQVMEIYNRNNAGTPLIT